MVKGTALSLIVGGILSMAVMGFAMPWSIGAGVVGLLALGAGFLLQSSREGMDRGIRTLEAQLAAQEVQRKGEGEKRQRAEDRLVEMTDSYTINREVDFDILEHDYEDELTATQALNVEIARAAEKLSKQVDGDIDDDPTAGLPLASVTELDTVQMPARDKMEDTLTEDDFLVETATVMMNEDGTVEMPSADNDDEPELDVDSGKVDTKTG